MNWMIVLLAWLLGMSPAQVTPSFDNKAESATGLAAPSTGASNARIIDKKHGGGIVIILDDTHYAPPRAN